ncbi:hypothetical protein [Polaromonas sp. CG9_12]|nr:hypothetical protein [Polaromonas sp. CG9_12]
MLVGSAHAGASSVTSGDKPAASAKKKKTGASGQVRFLPGSAEMPNERNSRLKRECQGQVNAGACAGYTR